MNLLPTYVSRAVLNWKDITNWSSKYFPNPLSDLHTTICYSSKPIDWDLPNLRIPDDNCIIDTVKYDHQRTVERFDNGAIVLTLNSPHFYRRHQHFMDCGGSHDYPEYRPYITVTFDPAHALDIRIPPFKDDIVFALEHITQLRQKDKNGKEEL